MKKLLATLALATAFTAPAFAQSDKTQGVSASEIVFGIQTDLSGPVASWGVPSRNAIQMRFEEENAKGGVHGRKLKLISEDSQYQVPRAVQAVNKLLNRDQVFAMIGNLGTPHNNAVFAEQFAANVPNLFPLSGARSMSEPAHPLKFQGVATYYGEARSMVKYFVKAGKKKFCTLYQDTEFGQEIFEAVKDELAAQKMTLAETATNKPTDTDFSAQMARLKAADCDIVILGTIVRDAIIPFVTTRRMGWNVDMASTTASFDFNLAGVPNGGTEGFYVTSSADAPYEDQGSDVMKKFAADYKAKFNAPATPATVLGYVSADIAISGLKAAGKDLTVKSFVDAMNKIKYTGFGMPEITFSPTKRLGTDVSHLYQVKSGRFVRVVENITNK